MFRQVISTDVPVHVGYYTRIGYETPFYYSPRRVAGLMQRCGIKNILSLQLMRKSIAYRSKIYYVKHGSCSALRGKVLCNICGFQVGCMMLIKLYRF